MTVSFEKNRFITFLTGQNNNHLTASIAYRTDYKTKTKTDELYQTKIYQQNHDKKHSASNS